MALGRSTSVAGAGQPPSLLALAESFRRIYVLEIILLTLNNIGKTKRGPRLNVPPQPERGEDATPSCSQRGHHFIPTEVERCVFSTKPWKAAGDDDLLAMVWRQVWPVVKEKVLLLF